MPYVFTTHSPAEVQDENGSTVTLPQGWVTASVFNLWYSYGTTTIPSSPSSDNSATLNLTVTSTVGAPDLTATVNIINDETIDDFTTSAATSTTQAIGYTIASTDWTLVSGTTYLATLNIDFNADYTNVAGATLRGPVNRTVKHPNWTGNLYVQVDNTGTQAASRFTLTAATFTSVDTAEFGAWTDAPAHLGRTIRDQRTGLPTGSFEMLEDGFLPGVWVSARQRDGDDPRNVRPTDLPNTEGEVGDDVPVV